MCLDVCAPVLFRLIVLLKDGVIQAVKMFGELKQHYVTLCDLKRIA